jgi:hypothetical protein
MERLRGSHSLNDCRDVGGKVSRVLCMCDVARRLYCERGSKKNVLCCSRVRITLEGNITRIMLSMVDPYGVVIPLTHSSTLIPQSLESPPQ